MTLVAPPEVLHETAWLPDERRLAVLTHLVDLAASSQAISQPHRPIHWPSQNGKPPALIGHGYVLSPPQEGQDGLFVTRTIERLPVVPLPSSVDLYGRILCHMADIGLYGLQTHGDIFVASEGPLDPGSFDPAVIGRLAQVSANMAARGNAYQRWASGESPAVEKPGVSTPSQRSAFSDELDARVARVQAELQARLNAQPDPANTYKAVYSASSNGYHEFADS